MCQGKMDAGVRAASEHLTTTVPSAALQFSLLSPLISKWGLAIDLGSKTSGSGFWARRFSLIVWVGGMCMAQSWASGERRGPGCMESLSPLPGPCSLQKPGR